MTPTQIKNICSTLGIHPARSRGQNFLTDDNIVKKIIDAADIKKDEIVLEVGPGLGILTSELLKEAKQVIAVEFDKKIYQFLQGEFAREISNGRLKLINQDILKVNLTSLELINGKFKVVANLPYSITSKFLRNFSETDPKAAKMVLMVQLEVAKRITAKEGEMSLLACAMQFYADNSILFKISRNSFWPEPEVDSAVIEVNFKEKLPNLDIKSLFRLMKVGFSAKRKQLHNNLANGLHLKNEQIKQIFNNLGWDENVRAQDLSVNDWVTLLKRLAI